MISQGILRLLGRRVDVSGPEPVFNRDDLAALLETNNTEQHPDPDNELKLFQNALDFADLRVRDCMVPRVDIEAVDIDASLSNTYGSLRRYAVFAHIRLAQVHR